jgi:hypothetical protein
MRIRAMVFAVLFAAICAKPAKAQTPTQERLQQAQASHDTFFDSKENQTLSGCSDEAWALMRYEVDLIHLRKTGPPTTAQEAMDKQTTMYHCDQQAAKAHDVVWKMLLSLFRMQEQGVDFVQEIRKQLEYLERLRYIRELVADAKAKIYEDHLFNSLDQLQARYDNLVARYNTLADSLATVPLPSNYERPRRLQCVATSNHLGEWSTITTDCQ